MRKTLATLGLTGLLVLVGGSLTSVAQEGPPDKVTICHIAGLASPNNANEVTLTVSVNALYAPGGHFNENGTTQAGHEKDYLGACRGDGDPETPPPVVPPTVAPPTDTPGVEPVSDDPTPIPPTKCVVRPDSPKCPDFADTDLALTGFSAGRAAIAGGALFVLGMGSLWYLKRYIRKFGR